MSKSIRLVDRIYISTYKHDVRFTRACVASIRNWYPRIPITLIKDRYFGDYSTKNIENWWHCDIMDVGMRVFGWGFAKLEPLFLPKPERFLVLDSDILFVGPVLDRLQESDADFVVQDEPDPSAEFVSSHYYDKAALRKLDPAFEYPHFTFNTGQWVGRTNLIRREDLAPWVEFSNPPRLRNPDIFKLGEQGLLNYFLVKGVAENRWTLARDRFMEVGTNVEVKRVTVEALQKGSPHRFLVHWCGCRHRDFAQMARGDLWQYFERRFYSASSFRSVSRFFDHSREQLERMVRDAVRRLVPRRRSLPKQ
jgi:hypothetical protein